MNTDIMEAQNVKKTEKKIEKWGLLQNQCSPLPDQLIEGYVPK